MERLFFSLTLLGAEEQLAKSMELLYTEIDVKD